jgi:predicted 2-oxoglutarate/Fe(II)-dependent dioxygenase YbiX
MLSKTDDMVGGQLSVFEEDKEHVIDLQVGETVVFFSSTWHQVTAVTKGGREVLVAWVYDNLDS